MKLLQALGVLFLVLAVAAPSRADLTIKMQTKVNLPQLQAKSPQVAHMAQMAADRVGNSTEYISAGKLRVDVSTMTSMIIDTQAHTMTMLMNSQKEFSITKVEPALVNKMLPGAPSTGGGGMKINGRKFIDMGATKMILGHKAHRYVVKSAAATPHNHTITMRIDMWVAQGFPAADMAVLSSMSAAKSSFPQVKGIPMLIITTFTGGPYGTMIITQKVTSISAEPIPASTYAIPRTYTQCLPSSSSNMGTSAQ